MCVHSECRDVVADRGMAHSEESRLANLLRRVSREDDRDRRLATIKQLKEFISHGESRGVSQITFLVFQSVIASNATIVTLTGCSKLYWNTLYDVFTYLLLPAHTVRVNELVLI